MSPIEPYLGVWIMQPETAEYEAGSAPDRSICALAAQGSELLVHTRLSHGDRPALQHQYRTHYNDLPVETRHGTLRTTVGDNGLISRLTHDGKLVHVVAHTRESDNLIIVDRRATEAGWATNRAVYARSSVKQVMVYRRDLKMRKGKIAAQCAHASMAVFFLGAQGPVDSLHIELDGPSALWTRGRFTKVVLSTDGEDEILRIHAMARHAGLPTSLITDAGKTEFGGVPTRTTVAIGPASSFEIDAITGPTGAVACKLA